MIGLVSTYLEGRLAEDAVRSLLACCQTVIVAEGPIAADKDGPITDWERFRKDQRVIVHEGWWNSDAEKRSWLLEKTRRYGQCWGIILDGDEALINEQHLPAVVDYYEAEATNADRDPLRVPLRLVDGDGTTSVMTGRVLRLDLVERYLISSYHLLLRNGVEVSLANGILRRADHPDVTARDLTTGMQLRRPLQGEPHILHRSFLRPPQRDAERQSVAEGTVFDRLVREGGLLSVHGELAKDERSEIWLPNQ